MCFCCCAANVAVCLNTIPFNVLTTDRPSIGKNSLRCFFSSFVTCLPKADSWVQIFNFTSYLCSVDGCKLILWQRAATVPNRGSILSDSSHWHQEQLQGGQKKVNPKWGWMSRNKRALALVFQGRGWYTNLCRGKSSLELIKVTVMAQNTLKSNALVHFLSF